MYFFLILPIENQVVASIQRAARTAIIGVNSPISSPSPPKNSTTPPNGTSPVGIPTVFMNSPFLIDVSCGKIREALSPSVSRPLALVNQQEDGCGDHSAKKGIPIRSR